MGSCLAKAKTAPALFSIAPASGDDSGLAASAFIREATGKFDDCYEKGKRLGGGNPGFLD